MKIIKSVLISLLFVPVFVFAQNQAVLPNAGLTPESPFYFIDKLGETLREFFTFNPEGKARLQITFAAERVAEIKVLLETKGVDAKGLEVAKARLQAHLGDAAEIVIKQKNKGKDISKLAKELDDEFEKPKSALADSFRAEKRALKAKEDELKTQLKTAHRAGDTAKAEAIAQELGQVKAQLELLELKEEDMDDILEAEEEKLEEEMEARAEAEKKIQKAENKKRKMLEKAAEKGVELSANAFTEFDSLLAQAKSALPANDFIEAKNFAKQAEKSLEKIEKTIENLDEAQEEEEKLEEEQEKSNEAAEAIQETEKKKQEILMEASKEGIILSSTAFAKFEQLLAQAKELLVKENFKGAKQLAEQAKDALEEAEKDREGLKKEKGNKKEQAKDEEERKREQDKKQQEEAKERNEGEKER